MSTSTGIPTSTTTLIEETTRIKLPAAREARGNGSITLSTARGFHTKTRAHGINMVNQGRVLKTEKILGDSHLIQGIDKVLAGMLQVVIDLQLLTGEEETWRPVVTLLAGMPGVAGETQCSPGSQTPLMVWIEAGKTPKCRVIAAVPVARACRHLLVAAVAEEDSPVEVVAPVAAEAAAAHVAVAEEAVAAAAVAGDNL
jgi:hypothetical protein